MGSDMKYLKAVLLTVAISSAQASEDITPKPKPKPKPVNPHEMICVKTRHDILRCANPDTICYLRMNRDSMSCFARPDKK